MPYQEREYVFMKNDGGETSCLLEMFHTVPNLSLRDFLGRTVAEIASARIEFPVEAIRVARLLGAKIGLSYAQSDSFHKLIVDKQMIHFKQGPAGHNGRPIYLLTETDFPAYAACLFIKTKRFVRDANKAQFEHALQVGMTWDRPKIQKTIGNLRRGFFGRFDRDDDYREVIVLLCSKWGLHPEEITRSQLEDMLSIIDKQMAEFGILNLRCWYLRVQKCKK